MVIKIDASLLSCLAFEAKVNTYDKKKIDEKISKMTQHSEK